MHAASLYLAGMRAAGELARDVYRLDVHKALDPLDDRDFLLIVRRIGDALVGATKAAEARALRGALAALDVNWAQLSSAARERVLRAAREAVAALPTDAMPRLEHVLETEAPRIAAATREATARRFGLRIAGSTTRTDARIAAFVRRSEGNFVRDQLGQRAEDATQRAREIVASGLEQGLGRDDIAAELAARLGFVIARGRSYWDTVAMSFANRGRTYAQVAAFQAAGIERYRFAAVLDEVTSLVCRFMHGREFSVARAATRFDALEQATSPAQVVDLQPWMRIAATDDGAQVLYYERAGRRHRVADVVTSAVGRSDETGRFARALDSHQLEQAGLSLPPLHGRCRSTVVGVA